MYLEMNRSLSEHGRIQEFLKGGGGGVVHHFYSN